MIGNGVALILPAADEGLGSIPTRARASTLISIIHHRLGLIGIGETKTGSIGVSSPMEG
jgi:hypothetical protein